MKLTCMIIDDEPNAVKLLEVLIQQNSSWHCLSSCFSAVEALHSLQEQKVDFIFLDINMPQVSGIELAALLPVDTMIVFTTAYSEFALDSFNFQTIDYLLKPITLKRFLAAVTKIENYFHREQRSPIGVLTNESSFFFKSGKVFRNILLTDILYFEGEHEYVKVVTERGDLLIYRRLKDIQEQLSTPFIRVHNSYIINTRHIEKIQDNHIYIREKQIPISEKFRGAFMEVISRHTF